MVQKLKYPVLSGSAFVVTISLILAVSGVAHADSCRALFASTRPQAEELLALNKNGQASIESYSAVHGRSLGPYREIMGQPFAQALAEATTWLDSGGGFGLAGAEAAVTMGKQVTVINPQDYWTPIFNFESPEAATPSTLRQDRRHRFYSKGAVTVWETGPGEGYAPYEINGLSEKYFGWLLRVWKHPHGFASPKGVLGKEALVDQVAKLAQAVTDKARELRDSGRFDFIPGYSEKILAGLRKKFGLITDVYGAYFYSANRIELISQYYDALEDSGQAFIAVQVNRISDVVIMKDKRRVPFWTYLTRTYPTVFSVEENIRERIAVLKIRRDPNIKSLDLRLQFSKEDISFYTRPEPGFKDYVIPSIRMREL